MDDELRELENVAQKTVNMGGKGMHVSEEMLQTLLNATGKTLGFAGKTFRNHREKKKQEATELSGRQTVSERIGSQSASHLENFNFTGKQTDLCYFANTNRMPLSAIDNIPDPELKENIIKSFDELCSKKYGCIKVEGDEIVITDKGKEMLQNGKFQKQALNDQLDTYSNRRSFQSEGYLLWCIDQLCYKINNNP